MAVNELARKARERKQLSQEDWADLAGVSRSVVRQFEGGANVTRDTMEKLLAPLNLTLLLTSKAEMESTRKKLEDVDRFLDRMAKSTTALAAMLAPIGLSLTVLSPDEIAHARSELQEVLDYLGSIEEQATYSRPSE